MFFLVLEFIKILDGRYLIVSNCTDQLGKFYITCIAGKNAHIHVIANSLLHVCSMKTFSLANIIAMIICSCS